MDKRIDRAWQAVVEALFEVDPKDRAEQVKQIIGTAAELDALIESWAADEEEGQDGVHQG